jgi:hypothetical protein
MSSVSQENDNYEGPPAGRAYWDLHEFFPDILPLGGQFGVEWHTGGFILRGDFDLTGYAPIARNDDADATFQHAIELQFGHRIGGGLRLQGIWMPTFEDLDVSHSLEGTFYQAALEPFFVFEHRLMYLRLGIMMPLDEPLGPPFAEAWGFRLGTGIRIE